VPLPPWIHPEGDGSATRLEIHAVPGARSDGLAGSHGDRLKVRVSAPPEGGRANDAIRALLAAVVAAPLREVELVRGASSRVKSFRIGLDPATVADRLGRAV
jgi:uncharacterized protein (TIGR00251 family)